MSFLGLGSFATGLVGGFAESANEALKKDISRINKKIDTISEFRVERAIKEQEERKAELDDITKALQEGEALFGDHPRASEFAASMLQDAGSLAAFKSEVSQLRLEQRDNPRNLSNFFEIQETNNPIGSTLDYARAYQGVAKTDPDYKLPEGVTGEDKTLLSKLGFDIDVSGRVQQQTQQMLGAFEIGKEEPVTFTLPSMKFKREDYNLSRMSASDRLNYINNELANPSNSQERIAALNTKLDTALKTAAATKDIDTQIDANTQMLDRMDKGSSEYASTLSTIISLTDQRDLRAAELSGSVEDEYAVRIRQAMREDNPEKAAELRREMNTKLGKGETVPEEVKRLESELMTSIADGSIEENSPEYKAAKDAIDSKKIIMRDQQLDNVSVRDFNAAEKLIEDAIDDEVVRQLGLLPETWQAIKLMAEKPGGLNALSDEQRKVYDQAVGLMSNAETTVLNRYEQAFKFDPSMIKAINTRRGGKAYSPESSGSTASSESTSTTETTGGTEDEAIPSAGATTPEVDTTEDIPASDDTTVTDLNQAVPTPVQPTGEGVDAVSAIQPDLDVIRNVVKPDAEGAALFLESAGGDSPETIYTEAMRLYPDNPEFATTLEYIAKQDTSGLGGLKREVAMLALSGLNYNQIMQKLIQEKDPSFDPASMAGTVSIVLRQIQPEYREEMAKNKEFALKQREKLGMDTIKPTGLGSRR